MTTALDVITSAMTEIGALQSGENPTNEEAQDCLTYLNDMIAQWELEGIAIGLDDLVLNTTIQLPRNHIGPIKYNLAMNIAPMFSLQPNQVTAKQADDGYTALQGAYGEPVEMDIDAAIRRRWYWPSGYSY